MRLAVFGTGYVGLVTGACFADTGNEVVCVDVDQDKIARLINGVLPIYEPDLDQIVENNVAEGRLDFTTDAARAIRDSDIIFIAVGTPTADDGSADISQVLEVARTIAEHQDDEKVVVTKSTVPVGTSHRVRAEIARRSEHRVHICSNPEFLKEGTAVKDCLKPDRIVIGTDSEHARQTMEELYAPFVRQGNPILFMDVHSAEVTKYAANAMLATRISFMNMIAQLCETVGADAEKVRQGVGTDQRIGRAFLYPGIGYGGSCFPKDVRAMIQTLTRHEVPADILESVERVNEDQKHTIARQVSRILGDDLTGRRFAVWGLAFKPQTDDMREAPSLTTIRTLVERGATVVAHDPKATENAAQLLDDLGDAVTFVDNHYDALNRADALLIHTEWKVYRSPNFETLGHRLARPLVIDGRNLYTPERMTEMGFEYHSVGRRPMLSEGAA